MERNMSKFSLFGKKGFGLIEVMVAAVVLGFLIVGLMQLQKGNRESILRVRARDAANLVAQHVLDSLGTLGINSLVVQNNKITFDEGKDVYTYYFESKNGKVPVEYKVTVMLQDTKEAKESTVFIEASKANDKNVYAKNLEATVSWMFKNSSQSIRMSKVVR
jgi:prepilin-type N-terminal cleavage/methylation domain-containing protein